MSHAEAVTGSAEVTCPPDCESLRSRVDAFLEQQIAAGAFPGASYAIGSSDALELAGAHGYSVVKPAKIRTRPDTIFDVASLTKPLITATLTLRAFADGKFDLEEPVSKYLEELYTPDKKALTFIDLLTHRGGFQAWYPLYTHGTGDTAYLDAIVRRPLRYHPGTREIYSCLGYVVLHLTLERVYGRPVEELSEEMIFKPLALRRSRFNPAPESKWEIAATEWGNSRERELVAQRNITFADFRSYVIWGEVNDGNSWYMGGVAGNAGLFSTASDVFAIAQAYLRRGDALLPEQVVERALRNYTIGLEENRGIGWQLQNAKGSHPSSVLSETCYGHTGFTGTSVWVDPERDLGMVLLTNRLHPQLRPMNMQIIRRSFHQIVAEEWDRRG